MTSNVFLNIFHTNKASSPQFHFVSFPKDNGLVPIVEPEILLDGEHGIDRTFEVAQKVWAEVFFYLAENNVLFEGILLKPSMVTPGAEHKERATPEQVASYTLKLLHRRIPPAVPGIMVRTRTLSLSPLSGYPYVVCVRLRVCLYVERDFGIQRVEFQIWPQCLKFGWYGYRYESEVSTGCS